MSLTEDRSLLAVARENKSIEIWKTDTFAQILVIPGHKNIDIRNIHWIEPGAQKKVSSDSSNVLYYARNKKDKVLIKKRRLVTTGLNGMVIEWDLNTCLPKSKYNAHGAVWDSKVKGKFVYLASEDGSIKIVKIKKTKIEIIKVLTKSSTSCLSLALVQETAT